MAKAPALKPREVAAILKHLGFAEVRQRGGIPIADTAASVGIQG